MSITEDAQQHITISDEQQESPSTLITPTSDSDSEEDDDDLLNFVAFAKKTSDNESDDESSRNSNNESAEDTLNEDTIQKGAETRAEVAFIPSSVQKPSDLHWKKESIKGKKIFHAPCRECHPDEGLGLKGIVANWNSKEKALVQYIYGTLFQKRDLVSRKLLTPYHGGGDQSNNNKQKSKKTDESTTTSTEWCKVKINALRKNRVYRGWDSIEIRSEQIYLQRVLDCALRRQQDTLKLHEEEEKESILLSQNTPVNCQVSDSSDESSEDDDCLHRSYKKSEQIRCGDVIEYTSPIYVCGDKRGIRRAEILAVDPTAHPILTLDNGEILPRDTRVKRVEIIYRDKLIENDKATYQIIESYKLQKDDIENDKVSKRYKRKMKDRLSSSSSSGIQKEAARMKEVMIQGREKLKHKAKESGFGDCSDILNRCLSTAKKMKSMNKVTKKSNKRKNQCMSTAKKMNKGTNKSKKRKT